MVNFVSNFGEKADIVLDYIPVVSTLSNLTNLFQKSVVLPLLNKQTIANSNYYTHLTEKSNLRCTVLLIPVIGNIIVGVGDFANRKWGDKDFMIATFQEDGNGLALQNGTKSIRDNKEVVLASIHARNEQPSNVIDIPIKKVKGRLVIQREQSPLQYASERLRDDKEVVLAAVQKDGKALQFASERLKDDKDIVLAAVQQNGHALEYASERLKDDDEIIHAAGLQNNDACMWASERFQNKLMDDYIRRQKEKSSAAHSSSS